MMKKEKKHKYVASDWYEFDEEKEKNIYLYVSGKKLKKRVEKNMDENVKFKFQSQWECYVKNKYRDFSDEKLKNFYYFLNQRGRNIKPVHDYCIMVFPVMLTLIFDKVYVYIQSMGNIKIDSGWDIVVGIVMYLAMMAVCLFAICKLLKEVFKTSEPEYFLKDYKVIIDNMIKERKKDL